MASPGAAEKNQTLVGNGQGEGIECLVNPHPLSHSPSSIEDLDILLMGPHEDNFLEQLTKLGNWALVWNPCATA